MNVHQFNQWYMLYLHKHTVYIIVYMSSLKTIKPSCIAPVLRRGSAEEPEALEVEMLSTLKELLMEGECAKGTRVCFLHELRTKQHQTSH